MGTLRPLRVMVGTLPKVSNLSRSFVLDAIAANGAKTGLTCRLATCVLVDFVLAVLPVEPVVVCVALVEPDPDAILPVRPDIIDADPTPGAMLGGTPAGVVM